MWGELHPGILGINGYIFLMVVFNFWQIQRAKPAKLTADPPLVSILVPARNEEANIEPCIRSLLAQDYPNFEVVVLDDSSTDQTWTILQRLCAQDPKLRLIQGQALPPGWKGKCFACDQLAQSALGTWLLFTDADTFHSPTSLRETIGRAIANQADLVTLFPRQMAPTWAESALVSFMLRLGMMFKPIWTMACGQYLCFRRSAYETSGGFAAVKNEIAEDLALGQLIRRQGLRLLWLRGVDQVQCRMYTGLTGIWNGYSRNYYTALGRNPLLVLGFLYVLIDGLFLPVILLFSDPQNPLVWIEVALIYGVRLGLAWYWRDSWRTVLLHPVAVMGVALITLNSWRWSFLKKNQWKGRVYSS